MNITIPEEIRQPVTAVLSAVGAIWGVVNIDVLIAVGQAVFASAPQIFTGVTISALTLPEFLPPTTTADWIGVIASALFGVYLLYKINQNFNNQGL